MIAQQTPVSTKSVNTYIANKLALFIKNFVTGRKVDLNIAIRMANRTGVLINDINLTRLLEISYKTKERFKTIVENHSFEHSSENSKSIFASLKLAKEGNTPLDKRIAMMRLAGKDLKEALVQQFRKSIAEKLMQIFTQQFGQMNSMQFSQYNECLHANFLQSCNVVKNWVVPRYFKLYFQLLA